MFDNLYWLRRHQMPSLSLSAWCRVVHSGSSIIIIKYGLRNGDGCWLKWSRGRLQSRCLSCWLLWSSSLEVGIQCCLSPGSLLRSFSFENLWLSSLSECLYRRLSWQLIVCILAWGSDQGLLPLIGQMMTLLQELNWIRDLAAIQYLHVLVDSRIPLRHCGICNSYIFLWLLGIDFLGIVVVDVPNYSPNLRHSIISSL